MTAATDTVKTSHPADMDDDEYRLRVRDALGAFTAGTVASWEESGHLPRGAVAELARRGVFRERWEHGAEHGLPFLVAYSQETCRHSSGLALAAMGHSEMFIGALMWLASSAVQLALLEEALDGGAVGCFAATEAHGGSDLAGIRTTATAVPGGWRVQGCKRYVSNLGGASHVLVLARPDTATRPGDLGLFIVPLDDPGVTVDGFFDAVGIPACDVGQVSLDVRLPSDALLGNPGLGLLYATHLLHFERFSICAQLLASAQTALRLAVAYARQRTVGGARVLDRQVIRHRLAGCQAELWNLEGRLHELTLRTRREAGVPAREIAAFKLTAGESAGRIVDTCMQVFGARGCVGALPIERIWRDSRLARLGGGTDEVLADLVASGLDRQDPEAEAQLAGYLARDLPRPEPADRAAGRQQYATHLLDHTS
jgi:alkylation response protein AidB-like acyl-CoA dehydrogenase